MFSIRDLFETPNVPNQQANGLTAPFGFIDPSLRNQVLLSRLQNLNKMDLDTQVKEINQTRG
jgi:hypothetical protein